MSEAILQRRRTLFAYFFIPGVAIASWVTRTPAIRDGIGASIAEMGLVLFGLSVGSMAGVLGAGRLVSHTGTRMTALLGLWLVGASLATMAIGVALGSKLVVALGLMFFGLGMGSGEIAINIDGAHVERLLKKPVLHALHGCFSLGTLVGAGIGFGLNALQVSVATHLGLMAAAVIALILPFKDGIPAGYAKQGGAERLEPSAVGAVNRHSGRVWADRRVILIGLVVFAMALAEGSANDWLPILMVDEHGFSSASGSLIFVAFAFAMTVGRFGGGWMLERFGRVTVIRSCCMLATAGIGFLVFGEGPALAAGAVLLWGLGASLGFPVALSAAGDGPGQAAERVKVVAVIGYVAMLVGPPMLGFVGETYGLRDAMMIVLALVIGAATMASAVGRHAANAPHGA